MHSTTSKVKPETAQTSTQVAGWLRLFIEPGQVAELRSIKVRRYKERSHTEAGFFSDLDVMAAAALDLTRHARGVYFTLNPLKPDVLARRMNRIDWAEEGELASDRDVLRRHWLLIDADPVRDKHISASEGEKARALATVGNIRTRLAERGWPQPLVGDSGNGYHLLYRIDLPADDGGLVQRVLKVLAEQFDDTAVEIDQKVFNSARICKVPGTFARKGDNVPDRPHRCAKLLSDGPADVVPLALLESLAAELKETSSTASASASSASTANKSSNNNGAYAHRLKVEEWLRDRNVNFRAKEALSAGRTVYLITCPFDETHTGGDTCVMQDANGKMAASCFHKSCNGRGWQEFKQKIGAPERHHYDPPMPEPAKLRIYQPEGIAGPLGVNEAENDPHRLARLFVADHLHDKLITLRWWREDWMRWDGVAYRGVAEKELRAELGARIKIEFDERNRLAVARAKAESKSPPTANRVGTHLVSDALQALAGIVILPSATDSPAWLMTPPPLPAVEVLACQNVLLHLPTYAAGKDGRLASTPAFFSPNALDYCFDPDAPPPQKWMRFLGELWPNDQSSIDALQEWFGYCLLPDTRYHKIAMIVGPKRSGKGTIARVLRALVGMANTTSPTLAGLGTQFGLWPLLNKTLAVISDARLSGRTDAAVVVERLLSISGEDPQTVDRKNMSPVTATMPVRFLILTNELPRLSDSSGALVGRLVVLRQTRSWYGREDTALTDRLLSELPGILLWALAGWKRLRERGRFEQPASAVKLVQDMEDLSSPIGAFIRERCEVGPGFEVPIKDLFAEWKRWCEEKGKREAGSEHVFGRDLRAAVPGLDDKQSRFGGMRFRVYVGIRLRSEDDDCSDKDQQTNPFE